MISIEFSETSPIVGEHWPLTLKYKDGKLRLLHDIQRDGDSISLSAEEWAWLVEKVSAWLDAEHRMRDQL